MAGKFTGNLLGSLKSVSNVTGKVCYEKVKAAMVKMLEYWKKLEYWEKLKCLLLMKSQ